MSSIIAQIFANSLIAGSIYALVASGFSLIYATNKFIHFAHGIGIAVGGYLLFTLFSLLGISFPVAALLAVVLTALFGIGIYRFVYLPMINRKASNVVLLIASVGILILFQNLIQIAHGAGYKSIGYISAGRGIDIFGAVITKLQIVIIIFSIILLVLLHLFMKKTKLGRMMRAVSDNKELSRVIGIHDVKISTYSFAIGSLLAGIAGVFIGLEQNLYPAMGTYLMIKGFTGAIIGGITSVPGSVLGSYLLGFAENFGVWFLPSGYKDAIAFVLLFLFLLLKPQGLFGISKGKGVKQ